MTLPLNDYLNYEGERVYITCLNWIPGVIAHQIRELPNDPSPLTLGELFSEPESQDWDKRAIHQRAYEWREILEILYPGWKDHGSGFEGLGSLFGSEEDE
jgi:hypothetical protein